MDPEGSLSPTQDPITAPRPDLRYSSPYTYILIFCYALILLFHLWLGLSSGLLLPVSF
jgi:hypothetical protein